MNLQKGQRWKYKYDGMVLEILDPISGQCVVKVSGTSGYNVGYRNYWGSSMENAIRRHNNQNPAQLWEYLEGQDAP